MKKEKTKDPEVKRPGESADSNHSVKHAAEEIEAAAEKLFAGEEAAPDKTSIELRDLNDKYMRLYAEFDNYKKRVGREKEDLLKFGNESLLHDLLPVIDSLELALKHGSCDSSTGVLQGVEITLKEFQRVLEKFGVKKIPAAGTRFDPSVHHAMVQVERDDLDEKMVAEELRTGYLYRDKVLRPSLVAVSVKPVRPEAQGEKAHPAANSAEEINQRTEEE